MLGKLIDICIGNNKKSYKRKTITPYRSKISKDIEKYGYILGFDKPLKSYNGDGFDGGKEIEIIGYEKQNKIKL